MNIKKSCLKNLKFYIPKFLVSLLLCSSVKCLNSARIFADCKIPEPVSKSAPCLIIAPGYGINQDGFSKSFDRNENKKLEATKIKEDSGEKEEQPVTLRVAKEKVSNAFLVSKLINILSGPNPDIDNIVNGKYTGFEIYVPRLFYTNNKNEIDKVLGNECRAFSEKLPISKHLHIIDAKNIGGGRYNNDSDDNIDAETFKEIINVLNGSKQNSEREIVVLSIRHEGETSEKKENGRRRKKQDDCFNAYLLDKKRNEKEDEFYKNSLFLADALTKSLNGTNCIHQREKRSDYDHEKYDFVKNNVHVVKESKNEILESCEGYKNVSAVMLECPSISTIDGAIASMNHAKQDEVAHRIAETLRSYCCCETNKEHTKKHFETVKGDKKAIIELKVSNILNQTINKIKKVLFAVWHESVEPGTGEEEWIEANLVDRNNGSYSAYWAPEKGLKGRYFVHTYVYFKDEKGNEEKEPIFVTTDNTTFEYEIEQMNAAVEAGSENTIIFKNITQNISSMKVAYYVKGEPSTPRWAVEITKMNEHEWKVKFNDKLDNIAQIDLHGVVSASGKNFKMAEFITSDNGNSFLSIMKNTPN